tara:strand:- start:3422 stop:11602 length:8181 start_codon:yes stop_codon:yes gene_type:complete
MPDIVNSFFKAKMNKDLDERLVPSGEYIDAENIQITTSDGSDVGTAQNLLGNIRVDDIINQGENSICVGSISNEKDDTLYWFVKSNSTDYILQYSLKTDLTTLVFVDTKANTDSAVLKFPNKTITGINIIDNLLFWTDNENEPRKINIDRCIEGTVDSVTHTKLIINGVDEGDIEEENITIIKKRPLQAPSINVIGFNPDDKDEEDEGEEDFLFENKFIRFSTRYKYIDGEYSPFGPFSQTIFEAGEFTLPIDEPYNAGMINRIKEIEIFDFVPDYIPKDVIQIDILYKEEDTNVVYSIANIKKTDNEWNTNNPPFQGITTDFKGKYTVNNENIYAAVPEDQLVRSWDNVPKKALSQEVTGNRIVYGNYTQGHNFLEGQTMASLSVDYQQRTINENVIDFESGGLPSIKSQRNYQLGIVYGDKYGRETPVQTSSAASIKIPWKNTDGLSASQSNQLTINLDHPYPPLWADYFKIFVKETSEDYHNLLMDKVYQNIIEDKNEEDTLWISFPSSDRNKVQEEDYLIMKKTYGARSNQVSKKNKFKILDISNQAPEAIKYDYNIIGSAQDDTSASTTPVTTDLFGGLHAPQPGFNFITMNRDAWETNAKGTDLSNAVNNNDYLFFQMFSGGASTSAPANTSSDRKSQKYRIASVEKVGDGSPTDYWRIRLANPIADADDWCTSADDFGVKIERRTQKSLEQFSGRFFVKIKSNELTKELIEPFFDTVLDPSLVNTGETIGAYYHRDDENAAGVYANNALLNFNGAGQDPSDDPDSIHSSGGIMDTSAKWSHGGSSGKFHKQWFIDALHVEAGQADHTLSAHACGRMWHGGNQTDGAQAGAGVVNGLEGFIVVDPMTNSPHATRVYDSNGVGTINDGAGAIRRWQKVPVFWHNESAQYKKLDNTYGNSSTKKYFMHLSFSGCGEDLHNGTTHWSREEIDSSNLRNYSKPSKRYALKNGLGNILARGWDWAHDRGTIHINNHDTRQPVDMSIANSAWEPGFNNQFNQGIVDMLKKGSQFVFRDDTNKEVYTIKRVIKKRLYNHTSWNVVYKWDGGEYKTTGESVEDKAREWADSFDVDTIPFYGSATPNRGESTQAQALMDKIVEFGKADNRRVCYILQLDKDPTAASFDPTGTLDSDTKGFIDFVEPDTDILGNLTKSNPAVFETEAKEGTDLNLYYEASNAIPFRLNPKNRELFAKPGNMFSLHTNSTAESWINADLTKFSEGELPIIREWESDDTIIVQGLFPFYNQLINGTNIRKWVGDSAGFPDPHQAQNQWYYVEDAIGTDLFDLFIKIYNQDGSFVSAKVVGWKTGGTLRNFNTGGINLSWSSGYNIHKLKLEQYSNNMPIGLNWYNCISFGNGVESNRVRDDFNSMKITNGMRVSSTIEQPYAEENRKHGLIYSGLYNSTSGINNLNQFIAAEKITKDLNPTYGSIQKLFSRRVSLVALCEDRIVGITANKNALYNADGSHQVVASNAVLGDANPFVGDYGISQNPESFVKESYRAYFTDKNRGTVLRLSMDGLTPISEYGMKDYFKDNLNQYTNLIGSYDQYKQDYNLTLSDHFKENLIINENIEQGLVSTTESSNPELLLEGLFPLGINLVTSPVVDYKVINNSWLKQEADIINVAAVPSIPSANISPDPSTTTVAQYTDSDSIIYEWTASTAASDRPFTEVVGNGGGQGIGCQWSAYSDNQWGHYHSGNSGGNEYWREAVNTTGTSYDHIRGNNIEVGDFVEPMTDMLDDSILHGGVKNYWDGVNNPYVVRNSDIFNGEEIRIQFKIEPTSGSSIRPRITLWDTDTDQEVDSSLLVDVDGGAYSGITDIHDPRYVSYTPGTNTDGSAIGWQTTSTVGSQWLNGNTINSEKTYVCHFKLVDPQNPEDTARIVIKKLKVRFGTDETFSDDIRLKSIQIRKTRRLKQPLILKGENNYNVAALGWNGTNSQVIADGTTNVGNWSYLNPITDTNPGWDGLDINTIQNEVTEHVDITYNGPGNAGMPDWSRNNSNVDLDTAIVSYLSGAQYWDGVTPASADNVTYFADGIHEANGSIIKSTSTSTGVQIEQDLTALTTLNSSSISGVTNWIDGNWYQVKLHIDQTTITYNPVVVMSGVLDSDHTSFTTNTFSIPEDQNGDPINGSPLPEGYVGTWNHQGSIQFDDSNIGAGYLEVIFKHDRPAFSDKIKLTLSKNCEVEITRVEINDVTNKRIMPNAGHWSLGNENHKQLHALSPMPIVYFKDGWVTWNNAYYGNNCFWNFFNNGWNTGTTNPVESQSGYELRFRAKGNNGGFTGIMTCRILLSDDHSASDTGHGCSFEINDYGEYKVDLNFSKTDATINQGDIFLTQSGTAIGVIGQTNGIKVGDSTQSGWNNKLVFNVKNNTGPANFKIKDISLRDKTNIFSGGSINNWVFSGFDQTTDQYITWDTYNLNALFDNAPIDTSMYQELNSDFKVGDKYKLKFDLFDVDNLNPVTGKISGYLYNTNGEGFAFSDLDVEQTFEAEFIIGDDSTNDPSLLRNTLVIFVSEEYFSGRLDNFVLNRILDLPSKTVSFSEDVKGWTSFKSFTPENGLSLSNAYYTLDQGRLWRHHDNEIRNNFYDVQYNSTITTLLNHSPSQIKRYNTLAYEGTKSRVGKFTSETDAAGNVVYNSSNHNLYEDVDNDGNALGYIAGWYVDNIDTNEQSGSVMEFIEKEGKWFNYIKGKNTTIDTSSFSFQGLGTVVNSISLDPNEPIFDNGNLIYEPITSGE